MGTKILFQLPICSQALEKNYPFAMWSSGAAAAAGGAILAGAGGEASRGWARGGLGVLPTQFGKVERAERRPATVAGGALGWWPLEL
jgi:hypothetical protein